MTTTTTTTTVRAENLARSRELCDECGHRRYWHDDVLPGITACQCCEPGGCDSFAERPKPVCPAEVLADGRLVACGAPLVSYWMETRRCAAGHLTISPEPTTGDDEARADE